MRLRWVVFFLSLALVLSGCSTLVDWQLARARQFEKRGNIEGALTLYSSALDRVPQSDIGLRSQLHFRIGECLWRLDRLQESFSAFERAVEVDASNREAQLRLGELYLGAGAPDRAAERARIVLSEAGENADALALLGGAAAEMGNNSLAIAAYQKTLEMDAARVGVAVALADIYNREDRVADARALLFHAGSIDSSNAQPWLALGRLEEQEGNSSAAEVAYRRAVSLQDTPETNLRLAHFLQRTSRVPEAQQLLVKVDAMRPTMPVAAGDSELHSGRAELAVDHYLRGIRSKPERQSAWEVPFFWRARSAPKDQAEAESRAAMAARVIEADLQVVSALRNRRPARAASTAAARLHLDQFRQELDSATISVLETELALAESDTASAMRHASRAVEIAPESASARYVLGMTKYRMGDRAGALNEWTEALRVDNLFIPARLALAADRLNSNDADAAEQLVVHAVREEPGNFAALILYARVLLAQDRHEAAEVISKRAAAIDPTSGEPHVLLGAIAKAQKRLATALVEYQQAVLLEPHSKQALEGLTKVYQQGRITRPMLRKLERVALAEPVSAPLLEIAGRLYADRGWFGDAKRAFSAALDIDPERVSAVDALTGMLVKTGQLHAATESASRLNGTPGSLVAAITYEERGDYDSAVREYEKALREGDQYGIAANNLAWMLAEKGENLGRALWLAQKARSASPKDPAILDTLGFVHIRRREYSQAVSVLQDAKQYAVLSNDPERPQLRERIREHLAEAYLRSGDTESAQALKSESASTVKVRSSRPAASLKRNGLPGQ